MSACKSGILIPIPPGCAISFILFVLGLQPVVHRADSCFCSGISHSCSAWGNHMECWGLNPGWLQIRQVPYTLYYSLFTHTLPFPTAHTLFLISGNVFFVRSRCIPLFLGLLMKETLFLRNFHPLVLSFFFF